MQTAIKQSTSKTSKMQQLLDHLIAYGHISPMDAWKDLGIYRLSEYIRRLRQKGWDIATLNNGPGKTCTYRLNRTNL